MDRYDYREALREDIISFLGDHDDEYDFTYDRTRDDVDDMFDKLYDELWMCDSVTGNASGSYTFNRWTAEENLCHNFDLLADACENYGRDLLDGGAEACDVAIRCYLLEEVLSELLDEMTEDE